MESTFCTLYLLYQLEIYDSAEQSQDTLKELRRKSVDLNRKFQQ